MFQHDLLPQALEFKFGSNPHYHKGVSTRGGVLVDFHPDISPRPTDTEQQQYVNEYLALPVDHKARNPKAARLKRFDALVGINAGLRKFIKEEFLQ